MLKWLQRLTKRPQANARKYKRAKSSSALDGIKTELAAIKSAQAQALGVSERVKYHSLCVKNNSAAIEELQKQVTVINQTVFKLSATLEYAPKTSPHALSTLLSTPDAEDFTHLQECTLIILWKLTTKGGSQWTSMKALVNSIYPGQDYNKVRTTIFEYVRIFEELSLVNRVKRGNRTFIALTKKGAETAKKKLANKKERLVHLPEIEA
ncbi:MAG: hypothetical protein A2293_06580 [Elusimicrobia bacterium RIFOXYB2_FULL_49_7]|nr:MAG: hypothetical protein A2293_06580 [Elusimicrobia bacterium RIFOXYB2_FULL_49_7]